METEDNDTYIAIIGTILMVLIVFVFLSLLIVFTSRILGDFAGMILLILIGLAIFIAIVYYIYKHYTQQQVESAI